MLMTVITFGLFYLFFFCDENRLKLNMTPYGEHFYYLPYSLKSGGLHLLKVFYHWEYRMDFQFSGNDGKMMGSIEMIFSLNFRIITAIFWMSDFFSLYH